MVKSLPYPLMNAVTAGGKRTAIFANYSKVVRDGEPNGKRKHSTHEDERGVDLDDHGSM
jgi:hypothetical protein